MNPAEGDGPGIEAAYATAVAIMQSRAVSFHQAFSQLPATRFRGVAALYAFCRHADDLVDQADGGAAIGRALLALNELETDVRRLGAAGRVAPDGDGRETLPWWPAFAATVRRHQIPLDSFLRQIEGQRMDAGLRDIDTLERLLEYCRLVAGSVGVMMLPLLADDTTDVRDPKLIKACEDLGVGMQITNILRDVGEDLRLRNRVYLPADLRARHGVSRSSLESLATAQAGGGVENQISPGFIALWEELASLAEPYYHAYEGGIGAFHPDCRVPLAAAALSYRAIADAVREAAHDCFTRRGYTSAQTRAQCLAQARQLVAHAL
jgi:phytoene synthase